MVDEQHHTTAREKPHPSGEPGAAARSAGAIVVGVDGSEASRQAVAWAVRFASGTGAAVHAVSVCAVLPPSPILTVPAPREDFDAIVQSHGELLADAVRHADPGRAGVTIKTSVVHGEPGRALCALATGAPALVVGSHGRGAVLSALLGSVSTYCVRHATCPVFVLPPTVERAQTEEAQTEEAQTEEAASVPET